MSLRTLHGAYHLSLNTRDPDRWTAVEWLKLYEAYLVCDWDITPDGWSEQQVADALKGIPPRFDPDGRPL